MEQRLFALEETVRCLMRIVGKDTLSLNVDGRVSARGDAGVVTVVEAPAKRSAANDGLTANDVDPSPHLDPVLIRLLLLVRALRTEHLGSDFDQDPAWTMMLELAWGELQGNDISVTSLCIGSGAPDTTALRYMKVLEEDGYLARRPDERDGRRTFVHLTPLGRRAMAKMMAELRVKAARLMSNFV